EAGVEGRGHRRQEEDAARQRRRGEQPAARPPAARPRRRRRLTAPLARGPFRVPRPVIGRGGQGHWVWATLVTDSVTCWADFLPAMSEATLSFTSWPTAGGNAWSR